MALISSKNKQNVLLFSGLTISFGVFYNFFSIEEINFNSTHTAHKPSFDIINSVQAMPIKKVISNSNSNSNSIKTQIEKMLNELNSNKDGLSRSKSLIYLTFQKPKSKIQVNKRDLDFLLTARDMYLRQGAKFFHSQNCGQMNCLDYLYNMSIENDYNPDFPLALVGGEVNFDCNGVSNVGAAGCFQFIPETAREYGLSVPTEIYAYEIITKIDGTQKKISKCREDISKCVNKNTGVNIVHLDERFNLSKAIDAFIALTNQNRKDKRINTESKLVAAHNAGVKGGFARSRSCPGKYVYECDTRNDGYGQTRTLIARTNNYMQLIQKERILAGLGNSSGYKTKF